MTQITLDSNPSDAPCCLKIEADDGRDVLIQTDYDHPGIARTFGWDMRECQVQGRGYYGLEPCDHSGTDGTVDCPECGYPAGAFIREAREWLDANDGATVEDPGYFGLD